MAAQTTGLTSFTAALPYGGARPSLFEFQITAAPTGVNATLSDVHLYCNVSEIPPLTLTPIERQYFGRTVKIPGDLVFADLTTTIINTEKYNVRNEIEKWMEVINDTGDNTSATAADFGTGTVSCANVENLMRIDTANGTYAITDETLVKAGNPVSNSGSHNITLNYTYCDFTGIFKKLQKRQS